MPSGAPELVVAMVPMVAADGWEKSAVYETVGGASVLILQFSSNTERGLDRGDFSLIGGMRGGRLNTSEDIESTTIGGIE